MPDQPDRPTLADELAGLIDKAAAKGVGVADDVAAYKSRDGHDLILRRGEAALYHMLLDVPGPANLPAAAVDVDFNATAVAALERLGRCTVARLREIAAEDTPPPVRTMDEARDQARRFLFELLDEAFNDPGLWADAVKSAAAAYVTLGGKLDLEPPGPDPLAERLAAVEEAARAALDEAAKLSARGYFGAAGDAGVYEDFRASLETLGAAV